jgi:toxin ParE1/3/4
MPAYKFSRRAEADLEVIIRYTLDNWGAKQASSYIDGLEKRAQSLADAPNLGKGYGDLAIGLRGFGFVYQSHVIYYLEAKHGVMIVRVVHQRMNPSLHL